MENKRFFQETLFQIFCQEMCEKSESLWSWYEGQKSSTDVINVGRKKERKGWMMMDLQTVQMEREFEKRDDLKL